MSGVAEDIRDALLDYQVGDDKVCAAFGPPKLGHFDRWANNGQYMIRTAG